ncbi:DUF4118 domain-containing protein [Frigoriglobus tundricola]|uniref:PAS domain-containing protein n=1 Tax=Frigoriglobus tundricola TaxID=2774151 RepID=A0A6M5YJT1_9BACT|nr:DUF4118 domain-containing protein [Frigoriglobus tundricola]QJW93536.1 hypothetical protein FTUN_1043 [Frigoriglobus tundricola]
MPSAAVVRPWVEQATPGLIVLAAVSAATVLAHLPFFAGVGFPLFILFIGLIGREYGFRYALVATVLSAGVIDYYFLAPIHSLQIDSDVDLRGLCVFALIAVAICWLVARETSGASGVERERLLYPLPFAQKLERSAQCLDALLANTKRVAAFTLDAGGRITQWSLGAEEYTGVSTQAVVGKTLAAVYLPTADAQQVVARLDAAVRDEERAEVSLAVRRADRTCPIIRAHVFPLWQAAALSVFLGSPEVEDMGAVELGGYLILLNPDV